MLFSGSNQRTKASPGRLDSLLVQSNSSGVWLLGSAFQKRLFGFAKKRNIDVSRSDWEARALRAAAEEHPELRQPKKGGRPRKMPKGTGIFFEEDERVEAVRKIDEIKIKSAFSEGCDPCPTGSGRKVISR